MGADISPEENRVLSAIRKSDKSAYSVLFNKYYPLLCAYAHKFVPLEDAEEIVQDVLFYLWQNRERVVINKSISSYLFRSVYNKILNKLTSPQSRNKVNDLYFDKAQEMLHDSDYYNISELRKMLMQALNELPETYRDAFMKHRFLGMSYKEIAEDEGVSVKTIDYRIQQALKDLRIKLKDYLPLVCLLLTRPFLK
ncbi:MAG: RNA polymerase sigma-70 factor [Bacteroidales bacterium]|jgi:RNA polymerase sigma-70 factor (ECF subfamily)|nr:RNA polymerase sigma-70 factor [Bacteroidales bacterium]